jgi:calcium-dependent protein kinase
MYMPPEIVKRQCYDQKCDIWSAGVVIYILLTGCPPFYGESKQEVYESIRNNEANYSDKIWSKISI